jgi:hypothetical protein
MKTFNLIAAISMAGFLSVGAQAAPIHKEE